MSGCDAVASARTAARNLRSGSGLACGDGRQACWGRLLGQSRYKDSNYRSKGGSIIRGIRSISDATPISSWMMRWMADNWWVSPTLRATQQSCNVCWRFGVFPSSATQRGADGRRAERLWRRTLCCTAWSNSIAKAESRPTARMPCTCLSIPIHSNMRQTSQGFHIPGSHIGCEHSRIYAHANVMAAPGR